MMQSFVAIFLLVLLHFFLEMGQDQLAGVLDVRVILIEVYLKKGLLSFLWSLKPPPK